MAVSMMVVVFALVGILQGDGHQRPGLHVHRVLGFVGEVGTPIFHLGDLRIGIPRMLPVLVGGLLLALAVQARQVFAGGSLDPRGLG